MKPRRCCPPHLPTATAQTWETPFTAGEQRQVAVTYVVERPITGLFFSVPDEAYPTRAEYAVTDNETERARYWLPCVDYPSVRTTFEYHLRADTSMLAVANGRLVGTEAHDDGTATTTYGLPRTGASPASSARGRADSR